MLSAQNHTSVEKFYAIYLICAILGPVVFLTYDFGYGVIHDSWKMNALGIYGFFIFSGIVYWELPNSNFAFWLVVLCLILQSFQCDILGFRFQFYYGPYFAIGYRDDVKMNWDFDFSLLRFRGVNHYELYSPDIKFYFNLIPIVLLIKFIRTRKQETEGEEFMMED